MIFHFHFEIVLMSLFLSAAMLKIKDQFAMVHIMCSTSYNTILGKGLQKTRLPGNLTSFKNCPRQKLS